MVDTEYNQYSEQRVHSEKLEIVRQTKLDLAQWITAGMATCRNPATSLSLARYAAAQLESAAMISSLFPAETETRTPSLLRTALRKSGRKADCFSVLTDVSRAMLETLAGGSSTERQQAMRDFSVVRLVRHEVRAARTLMTSLGRSAAA